MRGIRYLVLAGIIVALVACGTDPRRAEQRTHATIEALQATPDAEAWAAASLLMSFDHRPPGEALALIARATAAAPDRVEWQWLHAQRCAMVSGCDPAPIEARLRTLDPDNGAGWYGELSRAVKANDAAATNAALQQLAEAPAFNVYWTRTLSTLSLAAAKPKTWKMSESFTSILGAHAGIGIPGYATVTRQCSGDVLTLPQRRERCRAIARSFMQGDAIITEMIGISIAKQVWPEDFAEWRAATEARRVYDYRASLLVKHSRRLTWQLFFRTQNYVQMLGAARREQEVMVEQLRQFGENPLPPTTWTNASRR